MIQQSLNEMNACFNVPVDHVSLEELWASTTPQAAQGQTLKAYLKDVRHIRWASTTLADSHRREETPLCMTSIIDMMTSAELTVRNMDESLL